MENVIGLHVELNLNSGSRVQGVVDSTNLDAQTLLLKDVIAVETAQCLDQAIFNADFIRSIRIIQDNSQPDASRPPLPKTDTKPQGTLFSSFDSQQVTTTATSQTELSPNEGSFTKAKITKKKKKKDLNKKGTSMRQRRASSCDTDQWETDGISGDNEFDFQVNLGRFDKSRVFKELKLQDTVQPCDRLQAFNKRDGSNYGNRENILEPIFSDEWSLASSDNPSGQFASGLIKPSRRNCAKTSASLVRADTGAKVSSVTLQQLIAMEELKGSPTLQVLYELGGRGIADIVLKRLGKARLAMNNHNPRPVVAVFAGHNRTGSFALAAARQLCSRCRVIVSVLPTSDRASAEIKCQLKWLKASGARLLQSSHLRKALDAMASPVEIIIDAIFGSQLTIADVWEDSARAEITEITDWLLASQLKITLSIESCLENENGQRSACTIFLGFPINSLHMYGQFIHVVDTALPVSQFRNFNLESIDWALDWVISLNIV